MNILFLCTGNACRSQIAEGWARQLGGDAIEVQSAGIEAHGKNPRAIAVMQQAGIDISQQQSTRVTEEMLNTADLIVTVCGHADEYCPALPPGKSKNHWPLEDPARATGSEADIMQVFITARDDIKQRVQDLLDKLPAADTASTGKQHHESV
jgi:arsenate reductase